MWYLIVSISDLCLLSYSAVSKKISDFSLSLQIISDSQSAVGIHILNWASTNYTVLISQIMSLLQQVQSTAFSVSIQWTPGHATIAGNGIADRLIKMLLIKPQRCMWIPLLSPFRISSNQRKSQLYLNGSSAGTFLSLAVFSTPLSHKLIADCST